MDDRNLLHYTEQLDPPAENTYECPECGAEISPGTYLYFNDNGDCVGCEECIHTTFAEDYFEEE